MDTKEVIVTDVQMKFGSMVTFMIKWVLAAIPALFILFLLGAFMAAILGGVALSTR